MDSVNTLKTLRETAAFASGIAAQLKSGHCVLLYGELGSGKTTFTQQVGKALGIREPIASPTFTIAAEYAIPRPPNLTRLLHLDLYRLTSDQVRVDAAVQEVLESVSSPGTVTVIEWAERLPAEAFPPKADPPITEAQVGRVWKLRFTHGSHPTERIVRIEEQPYAS